MQENRLLCLICLCAVTPNKVYNEHIHYFQTEKQPDCNGGTKDGNYKCKKI